MSSYPMQDPSPQQGPSQLQQQLQRIAQTPPQPVPQSGPDQGSPVKRFLTNFLYGMGQGALEHVGLPTDYQKQQQVITNNQRQQELSQHAQEIGSMVQLHQEQTAEAQRKAQQEAQDAQMTAGGEIAKVLGLDPTRLLQKALASNAYGQVVSMTGSVWELLV
jgi:hypothetical protein